MLKRIKNLFNFKHKEEPLSVYERIDNLYNELNNDAILIKIGEDLVPHGDFICKILSEDNGGRGSFIQFVVKAL